MKYFKKYIYILLLINLTSCYEKLDFDQLDDFVLKPIYSTSLTSLTLLPFQFFNDLGEQQTSITDITNFEIFDGSFVEENVVKIDFSAEVKNEFDRDLVIKVSFLDEFDEPVYRFTPIEVEAGDLNYQYLEEVEIFSNPLIVDTFKVLIEAEIEDTGTDLNPLSTDEFKFISSVTVYIEAEI